MIINEMALVTAWGGPKMQLGIFQLIAMFGSMNQVILDTSCRSGYSAAASYFEFLWDKWQHQSAFSGYVLDIMVFSPGFVFLLVLEVAA